MQAGSLYKQSPMICEQTLVDRASRIVSTKITLYLLSALKTWKRLLNKSLSRIMLRSWGT